MKKKKKQSCSCTPQYDVCNENMPSITSCKPVKQADTCKMPVQTCPEDICGDYEITCVDKCVNLAKKAEELFEKALQCDCQATDIYNQAQQCEKSAQVLSQKANNLLNNANATEKEAKAAECKAQQLLNKAEELCAKAKCLYQEGKQTQKEAEANCESAKCLYEKAQSYNDQAKALYSQALKCDEKALECYKSAGEKIKEYELKSKKCEDMINKCGAKLNECANKAPCQMTKPTQTTAMHQMVNKPSCTCKYEQYDYSCNPPQKKTCVSQQQTNKMTCPTNKQNYCDQADIVYVQDYDLCNPPQKKACMSQQQTNKMTCPTNKQNYCNQSDIVYVQDYDLCSDNLCSTYVSPMYDMMPMQCSGNIYNKYPSLEMPNINPCMDQYNNMNDVWMNYYNYMQNMYIQNMMPYDDM